MSHYTKRQSELMKKWDNKGLTKEEFIELRNIQQEEMSRIGLKISTVNK